MKWFDAGVQSAKAFVDNETGEMLALKAWSCDNTHRCQVTDAVQPLIRKSRCSEAASDQSQGGAQALLHARAREPFRRHRAISRRRHRRDGYAAAGFSRISFPTVVVGNDRDAVHPMSIAVELAHLIPGASLSTIPSKSDNRDGYRSRFQHAITLFLKDL